MLSRIILRSFDPLKINNKHKDDYIQYQEDEFIMQLVQDEFVKFFKLMRKHENISKVGLVGSVAYYFSDTINQVAINEGIIIYKVMKTPIEALTLYHQAEMS